MIPIKFPEAEATYGRRYPPFVQMHVFVDNEEAISCWKLSLWERLVILWTGVIWLRQRTGGQKLRPELPQVEVPFIRDANEIPEIPI